MLSKQFSVVCCDASDFVKHLIFVKCKFLPHLFQSSSFLGHHELERLFLIGKQLHAVRLHLLRCSVRAFPQREVLRLQKQLVLFLSQLFFLLQVQLLEFFSQFEHFEQCFLLVQVVLHMFTANMLVD